MKFQISNLKSHLLLVAAVACLAPSPAFAQKKPKPALSNKDARRAVAETERFGLSTGAVKVRTVSPAGSAPVLVEADVTAAVRLEWVEDERVPQTGGVFKQKRWRAVEFRTGDRAWEEFDLVSTPAFAPRLEAARRAVEELVTEFEARLRAASESKNEEELKKAAEPLTRGALTIKQLTPMGSTLVAEVVVAATFTLSRGERGRWRAAEASAGGESTGDLAALWLSADARKAERARADLTTLSEALEAFRRERGFYVVARDSVVLVDHLSPRYAKRVVRLDPWRNPYRYEGTERSYTLASDGPDGKQGTPDDVTLGR
ncbi:MAG: type II secretion system protein GspG [Pyrinomonadaceae bacterium]